MSRPMRNALLLCMSFALAATVAVAPAAAQDAISEKSGMYIWTNPGNGLTVYTGQSGNYDIQVRNIPITCNTPNVTLSYETLTPNLQANPLVGFVQDVQIIVRTGAYQESKWKVTASVKESFFPNRSCGSVSKTVTMNVPNGVDPKPDLVTESISTPSGTLYEGETYSFFARIRNNGVTATSRSFSNRLRVDGSSKGTQSCNSLNVGSSCNPRWRFSMSPGNHNIEVCADYNDRIDEQNEGNNCRSVNVNVQARPDLRISSVTAAPSQPEVGEDVQVTVVARNHGQANSGSFQLALDVPGSDPPNQTCQNLGYNGTCTKVFNWTPSSAGSATLRATADPSNNVAESDEGNNNRSRTVTVTEAVPLPELYFAVSDISVSPSNPQVGDMLTFTFRMHNSGASLPGNPAPQMSVNGSGLSQTFDCTEGIPNAGGCVRTVTVPAPSTAGTHQVTATADPSSQIAEEIETNNTRTLYYQVADPTTNITCQGTWFLSGSNSQGQPHSTSSQGSVVGDCNVYFAQNQPDGCMATTGTGGLTAVWHRSGPNTCPHGVTVTEPGPGGEVWNYTVTIQ
ncbi:MAG: CARDB domain-containing protein [Acidobacteriota bacterium]